MREELQAIQEEGLEALRQVNNLKELESLRIDFFGRKGKLTDVMKGMGKLSQDQRPIIGKLANEIRTALTEAFESTKNVLESKQQEHQLMAEAVDVTLPG